jgi:hypothetical protein
MEQWLQFAQENWVLLAAALIVIIIVINVLKTVAKWLLIVAIIAGVAYYGFDYTEKLKEVGGQVMDYALQQAFDYMAGDAENAEYTADDDGGFTIRSEHLTIRGKLGSDEVVITFKGQSFTLKINDAIQAYIDRAKANTAV